MSVANPIVNGAGIHGFAPPTAVPGAGNAAVSGIGPIGPSVRDLQGTPPLTGLHNTPLHVATLALVALGVIVGLNMLGFRFAVDAGIGK